MFKTIIIAASSLLLAGCSNVVVNPRDSGGGSPSNPHYSTKAALRTSPEFLNYTHVGRPSSWAGSAQIYEFHLGQPIAKAIRSRLATTITLTESEETADIIIEPKVENFSFFLTEDRGKALFGVVGMMSGSGPTSSTELHLGLTVYDPLGGVLYRGTSVGQGKVTSSSSLGYSPEDEFTASASNAISDASQRALKQMFSDAQLQKLLRQSP